MKTITSATAMLALAALLSSGAYAATANETTPTTNTNQQTFFDQTATLRANLAADRAELQALIAGKSQDTKRIRTLGENISKSEDELRLQAQKNNLPLMGPGSMRLGMNCDSSGMRGNHFRGNMGHDIDDMMGNHH